MRAGDVVHALPHFFWSEAEIARALAMRKDWDIPESLVPFYGDWHSLLCLDPISGEVKLLDDRRLVTCEWKSSAVFAESLLRAAESPSDTSGIVEGESWLDI